MSATRPRLSALIVARNEEKMLGDSLKSIAFCDEIVVLLDRTTDRSAEIARSLGATVIEGAWELQGERRMTGIHACTGDWILEIDADERVDATLAAAIRAYIDSNPPFGSARAAVHNYVGGRFYRHGWGAYNSVNSRGLLFSKGAKIWHQTDRVHCRIEVKGIEGKLDGALIHHVDENISDMLARLDRYTTSNALQLIERGKELGLTRTWVRRFFTRFLKVYLQRKGYKEGYMGVMLGLFAGLYPLLSYLKAREILETRGSKND
ncbi:glycosyltransferase family 2 protein [Lacibacterium aquatile]|uniref:Glycosyltransferase family 2 protein n=1 Tax=Lacibacterium aquatile TaxID=1168082 RepID=A0ABW5DNT0_9PROT